MSMVTPLPTPPSRDDPINFSARADAFVAALKRFQEEINAIAPGANALQLAGYLAAYGAGLGGNLVGYSASATAQQKMGETIDLKHDHQAILDGSTDDLTPTQNAINAAIARGIRVITFEGNCYLSALPANRQEVVFLGSGKFSGPGAYGMRVCGPDAGDSPPSFGISAAGSLARFYRNPRKVVLVGDSLTTWGPNALDVQECFVAYLRDKISADNPGASVQLVSLGIGGRTFGELDSVPVGGFPAWYTNTSRPWLDYVADQAPDLVIVAMGMNGADYSNTIGSIASIYTKLKAFPTRPDVVFVTTPVPTTAADAAFATDYSTTAQQEARNGNAWAVRSCGRYFGFPVLDVNRQCNIVRDGVDVVDVRMRRLTTAALSGGGFVSPVQTMHAWSGSFVVPNRAAYSPNTNIAMRLDGINAFAFLSLNGSNQIVVELYGRLGNPYATKTLTSQVAPNSPHTLNIVVANSALMIFIGGNDVTDPIPFVHERGIFTPAIGNYLASMTNGQFTAINSFDYAEPARYLPSITNNEMWAVGTSDAGTKLPYGGNGINHPTSMGASRLYKDVVAMCDFSAKVPRHMFIEEASNSGSATLTFTPTIPAGQLPNPAAKSIFVYVRAWESTGAEYSTAWYRLYDFGNGHWILSAPIGKLESTPSSVSHSLAVNASTGALTLTNTYATPSLARNNIGTSYEMNLSY